MATILPSFEDPYWRVPGDADHQVCSAHGLDRTGYHGHMPSDREQLPSTLERSSAKAQRTYRAALDSAHEQYGDEERAHRVAFSALKRRFEKQGDRWVERARRSTARGRRVGATKRELMAEARRLDVRGRSTMSRDELMTAVAAARRREQRR